MTTSTISTSRSVNWGGLLTTGLIAGVVAAVVNTIVYFIAQALGVDFMIVMGGAGTPAMPLAIPAIAIFSIVPGLIAALLAGSLLRFTSNGARIFQIVALVFLLISFIPDLTMPEPATMATKASLMLMHVIAGSVITYMVSRKAAE